MDYSFSLDEVKLVLYSEFQPPCKDVEVANGTILNQGPAQPFYLHGDIIRVQCDEGFGVEEFGYVRDYEVQCSFKIQMLSCIERIEEPTFEMENINKTIPREGPFSDRAYMAVLVSFSFFVCLVSFLLIVVGTKAYRYRKIVNNLPN